jgi:potassium-transporting ATPase potassium-binding subunit
MTWNGWAQILAFSVVLFLVTKPVGLYLTRVYDGSLHYLASAERLIYRICGIDPRENQHWLDYLIATMLFSAISMLVTYVALRAQGHLPLNPRQLPGVVDRQAFETAASFATNTDW